MVLAATGNFLIPNGTFVFELVIFLLVLGVVAKWILPPLQAVAEERRGKIRADLEAADAARAEVRALGAEREAVLAAARTQARGVVDEANRDAERVRGEARSRGLAEHDRLVDAALLGIDADRAATETELLGRLDSLVVAAAERIVGSSVDPERHRSLIDEAVAAAKGTSAGAPGASPATGEIEGR